MLRFFIGIIFMTVIWILVDNIFHVSRDWLFLAGFFVGAFANHWVIVPIIEKEDVNR